MLNADRHQIEKHVTALFVHADNGSYVSLRAFEDKKNGSSWGYRDHWRVVAISDSLAPVIDAAVTFAEAAANATEPVVFCPPICTFNNRFTATEADLHNGLVLVVEIDSDPQTGKAQLEAILGLATETIASGGTWTVPATGEVQDRLHVYWRLDGPTRTAAEHAALKECRDLAARLIGSDTSAVPLVHPMRWPGSWHRKATPRLARIVEYNPDNEIVLADALVVLRETASEPAPQPSLRERLAQGSSPQAPILDVLAALACILNDDTGSSEQSWKQWSDTGLEIYAGTGGSPEGLAAYHAWSAKSKKYNARDTDERWAHFTKHPPTRTGAGALFKRAGAARPDFIKPSDLNTGPSPSLPSPPPPQKPWPTIATTALHGLVGEFVALLIPHTEADPVAILVHFLVEVGSAMGRSAYYLVEADRHHTNLFALIVGSTSKARKGTSAGRVKQLLEIIDPQWVRSCFRTGLSTGEGLIWNVRDEIQGLVWTGTGASRQQVQGIVDPGVEDKRLLVIEAEFARTISVMERPGNTLSAILRAAWDHGDLEIITKTAAAKATGAHISVVSHITSDELADRFTSTDKSNGFGNRFLFALVRRSQLLPFGGKLKITDLVPVAEKIAEAIEFADTMEQVGFSPAAETRWEEIYTELSKEKPGLTGSVLARGEAQVIRLALIYALLDKSPVIDLPHLEAARELWAYCEASAAYVFGDATGNVMADEILLVLRQAGPDGMTRSQLKELFVGHHQTGRISAALALLLSLGKVRSIRRTSGGRPTEVWIAV
jgi:hypothetical protein